MSKQKTQKVQNPLAFGQISKSDPFSFLFPPVVRDVMTPKSRLRVSVMEPGQTLTPGDAKRLMHEFRVEKLPLVDQDWNVRALVTSRDLYHYLNNPYSSHDKNHRLLVGAAVGVKVRRDSC